MIHQESRQTYGSPSIWYVRVRRGQRIVEHRVARLMRQGASEPRRSRSGAPPPSPSIGSPWPRTSWSRRSRSQHPIECGAAISRTSGPWRGGSTWPFCWISTPAVWSARRWAPRLTVDLAERVLTMALANWAPVMGLLHHSDRGSQYAATSYQRLLGAYGLRPSMSRKGNCWDNACVESFFGTLKRELGYH